ncbi:AfsR/SARP family transcriptional regulator [Mycobacterium kansasii]
MTAPPCVDWYFRGDGEQLVSSAVMSLGQPTPPVMAIMAEPDSISVLPGLDAPFPSLPQPWTHVPQIDSWTCRTTELSPSARSPLRPVLLPLGATRGAVLLVDLEHVSPLALTGHDRAVTAVQRAWVLNLLLTPSRIVAATAPAIAKLDRVGSNRFITALTPETLHRQLHQQHITPDVVVLAEADPRCTQMFHPTPCILINPPFCDGWAFELAEQTATLANNDRQLAVPIDAVTTIDDTDWHSIIDTLRQAATNHPHTTPQAAQQSSTPPTREDPQPPQPPLAEQPPTLTAQPDEPPPHVWVRIMGEPIITPPDGRDVEDPGRSRVWTSVIAYLATIARDGATREELKDCWPPNTPVSTESIRQTVSRIRRFLGEEMLPQLERGGRRSTTEPPQLHILNPTVLSDWERWQQLLGDDPANASDDALAQALALVRGPAFDVPANCAERFKWAKFLKDEIDDAVPDAALILATRLHRRGDHKAAAAAALTGLKANPQRQDLWRLALNCSPDPLQRSTLIDELRRTIRAADIEPETRKLIR